VWYHDHAFGITRTNAYAGIASGYVINDPAAEAVVVGQGIPSQVDLANTHYFIFQDKYFFGPAGPPAGYPANAGPGDLGYPYIYDPALFGPAGVPSFPDEQPLLTPFPTPSVVPEMFGDTMLVNGTAYPVLEVKAKRQRFVMLNACSSRFLNPRLVQTAGTVFPDNTSRKALLRARVSSK
jgi:spore coat protein A